MDINNEKEEKYIFIEVNGYFDVELMKRLSDVFSHKRYEMIMIRLDGSSRTLYMKYRCEKDNFDFSPDAFYEIQEAVGVKIKVSKRNDNEGLSYIITVEE